ncbi:hypothetical protein BJV74DRAFT_81907 [Russula compacta]|nr:hypothetical protein BJV74DRAFT_81907 [Russula compacta]
MIHDERLSSISRNTHRPPTTCSSIQGQRSSSHPHHPSSRLSCNLSTPSTMSLSQTPTATTSSSNYQAIFDNALEAYKKRTKKDLRSHPLFAKLEACDSPDAVLATLREQISGFDQSGDDKRTKWLNPTVNVLYNFSTTIGGGISLAYPPAGVIFTGIGILLSAVTAVSADRDALADVFERIECFFSRLETYTELPPTAGMTEIIIKIMTEVLSIVGIATKEIKQSIWKRYLKKLMGRTDMEDGLRRLDRLTQEEVRMAAAQGLKAAHEVDNKVQGVDDKIDIVIDGGEKILTSICSQNRDQIRRDLKSWLSPQTHL